MDYSKDYYGVLGVLPTAELVVIGAAYRALAKRYHPDIWRGDPFVAESKMRELNEAYEVLSDEEKRSRYDSRRNRTAGSRAGEPSPGESKRANWSSESATDQKADSNFRKSSIWSSRNRVVGASAFVIASAAVVIVAIFPPAHDNPKNKLPPGFVLDTQPQSSQGLPPAIVADRLPSQTAPSTLSMTNRSDTQGPLVTRSNQATTDTRRMSQSHQLTAEKPDQIPWPAPRWDASIGSYQCLAGTFTILDLFGIALCAPSNVANKTKSVQNQLVPEGSPGVAISTSPMPAQPAATEIELAKPVQAAQPRRNQKPEEAPLAETKPRSPRIQPSLAVSNFAPKAAGQSVQAPLRPNGPAVSVPNSGEEERPLLAKLKQIPSWFLPENDRLFGDLPRPPMPVLRSAM